MAHNNHDDDDDQLQTLLNEWKTPQPSETFEKRVLAARKSPWGFLLHGYFRVPVPLAACLGILLVFGAWKYAEPVEKFISCVATNTSEQMSCPPGPKC